MSDFRYTKIGKYKQFAAFIWDSTTEINQLTHQWRDFLVCGKTDYYVLKHNEILFHNQRKDIVNCMWRFLTKLYNLKWIYDTGMSTQDCIKVLTALPEQTMYLWSSFSCSQTNDM